MNNLIIDLKKNQEDFEFYPTTDEMLKVIVNDIKNKYTYGYHKLLDIGCGTCKIMNFLDYTDFRYFVIEKSKILIDKLPKQAIFIGADFNNNSLIDKYFDIIFSNPPYSEFEDWTIKILSESNADYIYLIIPERWKYNNKILDIIHDRNIDSKILYNGDFLNAERQARAKIDIVRFKTNKSTIDGFDFWFKNNFKFEEGQTSEEALEEFEKQEEQKMEIAEKKDIITTLVENYEFEMQFLQNNFLQLTKLNGNLFKQLEIDLGKIKTILKDKIRKLKYKYWRDLFNKLPEITGRLIFDYRHKLLTSIEEKSIVDFNKQNIYGILLYIIEFSKRKADEQLKEMYLRMIDKSSTIKYKSNKKVFVEDRWRYINKEMECVKLDYRIVVYSNYYFECLINDIITIAHTLGFNSDFFLGNSRFRGYKYEDYKSIGNDTVYMKNGEILFEYKTYNNGNAHFRFNKDFIKKFNVEAGRILGWIKNKEEAKEEFELTDKETNDYYGYLLKFTPQNQLLLTI